MEQNIVGRTVHFAQDIGYSGNPNGQVFHQGEVAAIFHEKYEDGTRNVKVVIACTDLNFREVLLLHCKVGARPETQEQLDARLLKRREREQ